MIRSTIIYSTLPYICVISQTVLFGHALSQLQVGGVPAKTLHAPTTQHFAQDRNNHGAKVDEDREDDREEMEEEEEEDESEGCSEDDYSEDEEETHYFIDTLRTIVDATPLSQLLLCPRGEEHETVSSLQVQSLVSVINADLSGRTLKNEPKHVVVETCSHIITAMQGIYTSSCSSIRHCIWIRWVWMPLIGPYLLVSKGCQLIGCIILMDVSPF